jgi:hypothetical protein
MHAPTLSLTLLAALLVPALASAAPPGGKQRSDTKRGSTARVEHKTQPRCVKTPVEVTAGTESVTFSLAKCDGGAAPTAVEQLSVLARPATSHKPTQPLQALAKSRGPEVAPGIRRVDARLVERLELAVDHFRKAGERAHVVLVSGYRPRSTGSYHSTGRAVDFRIEGVTNEALVAFCKTLPDTGCGYYPNSLFVHMDVREPGAGHVSWIDASKPGETPHYVTAWPPSEAKEDGSDMARADALPALPAPEDHPRPAAKPDAPKMDRADKAEKTDKGDKGDKPRR